MTYFSEKFMDFCAQVAGTFLWVALGIMIGSVL